MSSSPSPPPGATRPEPRVFDPLKPRSERGQEALRATEEALKPPVVIDAAQRNFLQNPKMLVAAAIVCVSFAILVQLLAATSALRTIVPHHNADCRRVLGPIGAEDVVLDRRGVLLISSDARSWLPKVGRDGFTGPTEARTRMATLKFDEQGAIWAYDSRPASVSATAGQMAKLDISGLPESVQDVHPHGLSVPVPDLGREEKEEDYPVYLYIANHARNGDEIIVVEVKYELRDAKGQPLFPPTLHYKATLQSATHLTGINEVEALYPQRQRDGTYLHSVYVSNFLGSAIGDQVWNLIELGTKRPWGSVVLCQGLETRASSKRDVSSTVTTCTTVVPSVSGPNGLALSADRTALYVARTVDKVLETYELPQRMTAPELERLKATKREDWSHSHYRLSPLKFVDSMPMHSDVDNISVDELTGDLFIGAHPKPWEFVRHHERVEHPSPSQVLRVRPKNPRITAAARQRATKGEQIELTMPALELTRRVGLPQPTSYVDEVFLDDGRQFSGSSAAVWNRATKQLIIGAIAVEGILVCPYPALDQVRAK